MKQVSREVLAVLFVLLFMVGCSKNSSTEQQASAPKAQPAVMEQAQPAQNQPQTAEQPQQQAATVTDQAPAPAAPVAQTAEIRGTVVKTEEGVALFSDSGNFLVNGQQLDELVGKNVRVTATMAEGADKPTITVLSVSVIE